MPGRNLSPVPCVFFHGKECTSRCPVFEAQNADVEDSIRGTRVTREQFASMWFADVRAAIMAPFLRWIRQDEYYECQNNRLM